MTKGRAALRGREVAEQKPFSSSYVEPQAHDPLGMTKGRVGFPVGFGCSDPRSQTRDLGHPSISPFDLLLLFDWLRLSYLVASAALLFVGEAAHSSPEQYEFGFFGSSRAE
jgi:hypothetical protein